MHRWQIRVIVSLALVWLVGFLFLNLIFPLPKEKLSREACPRYLDRHGQTMRVFLAPDDSWHFPLSDLDLVSPSLQHAVLTYEDRWFYWHFGFNPISLANALIGNFKAGERVRGGSTITMQLARLIEPKNRTVYHKLVEIFRSIQIEMALSKKQIFTTYLNLAPYGGNIVGISAASKIYFGKSLEQLSLGESALLAALPNSPTYLRPDFYPTRAKNARNKVLSRLLSADKISLHAYRRAIKEPIPKKRHPIPFEAPHLTRYLHLDQWNKIRQKTSDEESSVMQTTIDLRIQKLTENILQQHLVHLQSYDIGTGAIIVMNTKNHQILSWVGSASFFDKKYQGQVDGALAPRSPGSTLKPFIYSLALNNGEITPERLLDDVPIDYSGYQPDNYDGKHRGYVTAKQALAESLNVPAVELYASLKVDGLYDFLKDAGITTLTHSRDYYGLPLILGSAEVNLVELTNLYCGLANLGTFSPYQITIKPTLANSKNRLLSREASYILSEMLSSAERPDLPSSYESTKTLPKVAWKTGTSYGHRDAWSIGYTPELTIGVWVGNFDGHGVPALVGSEVAAPILFDLFGSLQKQKSWFLRPYGVNQRTVCALSGMIETNLCAKKKKDFYIVGLSNTKSCQIHQKIMISHHNGVRLCSHCRADQPYDSKVFEIWPSSIATWLNNQGMNPIQIPQHDPNCRGLVSGLEPIIRSPTANTLYKIRSGIPLKFQKILLEASVSSQTQKIYWFLNGKLVASHEPTQKVFILPKVGRHNLVCVDDEGRSTSQKLHVLN